MPILTGPAGTPVPVHLPGVGFATARYIDPAGIDWPLTNQGAGWLTLAEGVSGLGAAKYTLTKDSRPRGGSKLRHAQPEDRTILWPLYVYGSTHMEFVTRWRALASAFTSTLEDDAPGWLEIARPDGTRRRVAVFYEDGFEGQGKQGTGITSDTAVLQLYAEDPYWFDPAPTSTRRRQEPGVDFLSPYPSVSSSQVLGATTLVNHGDVEAWPTWTITGPATLVTMTNDDTGESFSLDPNAAAIGHGDLATGEVVTVTTDPPQVRFQDGAVWSGALNWPDAVLWSLRKGVNHVTFALDGAGDGSTVDVSFTERYETA